MPKNKMSEDQKLILIYSVELGAFAVVFFVLAFLKLFNIWATSDARALVFNIVTSLGGLFAIGDILWALLSKKRIKRVCLLDKFLNLPLGLFLLVFDVLSFINRGNGGGQLSWHHIGVAIAFFYASLNFGFQAIYHYKKPIPAVMIEIQKMHEEEEKEKLEAQAKAKEEQNEKHD